MIIKSHKIIEEKYRKKDALNSSKIKHIWNIPEFNKLKFGVKDSLPIFVGNYIDISISYGDKELKDFLDKYIILDEEDVPSIKKLKEIIEYLAEEKSSYDSLNDIPDEFILDVKNKFKYTNISKGEKLVSLIKDIKSWDNYFKALKSGKMIVPEDTLILAEAKVIAYKEYFEKRKNGKDISYLTQVDIYSAYNDVNLKILVDLVEVNHEEKTISLIDTKSTEDLKGFRKISKKLYYKTQAAFYFFTFSKALEDNPHNVGGLDLRGYTLLNEFNFIVIDNSLEIRNYLVDDEDLYHLISDENNKYNILNSIELYKWHLENGFDDNKFTMITGKHKL